MFGTYPRNTTVRVSGNGNPNQICLDLDGEKDQYTPGPVGDWLRKQGWNPVGTHPDTDADLWQHSNNVGYPTGYFLWEQAVAYEMFLFMNIGPGA